MCVCVWSDFFSVSNGFPVVTKHTGTKKTRRKPAINFLFFVFASPSHICGILTHIDILASRRKEKKTSTPKKKKNLASFNEYMHACML